MEVEKGETGIIISTVLQPHKDVANDYRSTLCIDQFFSALKLVMAYPPYALLQRCGVPLIREVK